MEERTFVIIMLCISLITSIAGAFFLGMYVHSHWFSHAQQASKKEQPAVFSSPVHPAAAPKPDSVEPPLVEITPQ